VTAPAGSADYLRLYLAALEREGWTAFMPWPAPHTVVRSAAHPDGCLPRTYHYADHPQTGEQLLVGVEFGQEAQP
jgi:hypothetical protein